jgi:hypothetical protein
MQTPDYPAQYVPQVREVHPKLQDKYSALHEVMLMPSGLFKDYPYLIPMLAHNLAFLGRKPIMLAHNLSAGPKDIIDLFHHEVVEYQAETPLLRRQMEWQHVDGAASKEGVDMLFFGGFVAGMLEADLGSLSEIDLLSFHLALMQMRDIHKAHPQFNPFDEQHIRKVVHPDEGKNWQNYPEGATQAGGDWSVSRMTNHYLRDIKPPLRVLRDDFGGVLPREVATAINEHNPKIPEQYRSPASEEHYNLLYQAAYHGA